MSVKAALDLPWILASGSPRRQELLKTFGRPFQVVISEVDEDALTVEDPEETARILAFAKAEAAAKKHGQSAFVIGGDTVVALGQTQFSKPTDRDDCLRILSALSGQTHRVMTALAIVTPYASAVGIQSTAVTFRHLTLAEIAAYADTDEPYDKAGAYAIQGGAAGFVDRIDGDLDCVIGFPTRLFQRLIES